MLSFPKSGTAKDADDGCNGETPANSLSLFLLLT
jgi:hypothetical protein